MIKFLSIVALSCLIFFVYIYTSFFVYPNTYLGSENIFNFSPRKVRQTIEQLSVTPIQIQVKDRMYEYPLPKLGIIVNTDKTYTEIFAANKIFPLNLIKIIEALYKPKHIIPYLTFTQDFYSFAQNAVFEFGDQPDSIKVNTQEKTLEYEENKKSYKVDPESLKAQIIFEFGKGTPVKPTVYELKNDWKDKITRQNDKLEKVYERPLTILIQNDNQTDNITISPHDIKNLVSVEYKPLYDQLEVFLNEPFFYSFVESHKELLSTNTDRKVSVNNLKGDVLAAINTRLNGSSSDTITTKIDYVSNTSGELADQYIEVDISQQKMYLFKDGNNIGAYTISSGLYYPTPTGQFKIMNKAVNAFSDIYHVWMPYWMAFYYDPKINATMGIHELPYWVAGDGSQIRRPREFIGSPHTAGCVALDLGMAKIVYDFSYIGMPVFIYQ